MKVLFVAPYIYAPEFEEHSKNKSGFGIMVYDIACAVNNCGNEVVIATRAFGPKRQAEGLSVAKNSLVANIIHGKYRGVIGFCKKLKSFGASKKEILRNIYYYLNVGYIANLVKTEKPDVVHIHGCTEVTQYVIAMLKKRGVNYVVTLHGLLQDDNGGSVTGYLKACERELIKKSHAEGTTITVIGSGMKKKLVSSYYSAENTDNVTVITNGIDVTHKEKTYDIREKYGISADKKIILSVGSVCALKNQIQAVRAFSLLPQEEKEKCVLMFVGTMNKDYPVLKEIEALSLTGKVFCVGFVPRDELNNYYLAADLAVSTSVTEGFGLPMAEGFVYGVPCVTFSDLDAVPDLYNEDAMLLCSERSDEALAEVFCQALNKNWDKKQIMEHRKTFSLEAMAEKYQGIYERLN